MRTGDSTHTLRVTRYGLVHDIITNKTQHYLVHFPPSLFILIPIHRSEDGQQNKHEIIRRHTDNVHKESINTLDRDGESESKRSPNGHQHGQYRHCTFANVFCFDTFSRFSSVRRYWQTSTGNGRSWIQQRCNIILIGYVRSVSIHKQSKHDSKSLQCIDWLMVYIYCLSLEST